MTKKIKVAVVYHILAHYREPIFHLMSAQDSQVEYTFFSDSVNENNSVKPIDPAKADIPVSEGGIRWRFLKNYWFKNFLWQKGLVKLSCSKEFDAIIYLGVVYSISTWISAIIARIKGKGVFMWSHGFIRDEKGFKGWLRKTFYKLADCMLLYHERAKEIMARKGFKPGNLYVIYNSLDYDIQVKIRKALDRQKIDAHRNELFKNPDFPVLLFIGRLTPQKKLFMIIEAAAILKEAGRKCNILFVGTGPEKDKLSDLAKSLGLDDCVCFYGDCYEEEKIGLLIGLSDICIAPGEVGLTCMHSLVYGTPVITHDNPDFQMPEYEAIKPGFNGEFFVKDDTQSLADSIDKWLSENKDNSQVAENCYKIIDDYYNPRYQLQVINRAVEEWSAKGV